MDSLAVYEENQLPETLPELSRFVLVGREKLKAVRAEIRAIDRLNLATEVREQKLAEAQGIAEAVLDAEIRLGELFSELPRRNGMRSDLRSEEEPDPSGGVKLMTKQEAVQSVGFSTTQADRFESLASHKDIVERMKTAARENNDIVNRTAILNAIAEEKKPPVWYNFGDTEWYTPAYILKAATKVLGNIDLDPASCEFANRELVHADKYYSIQDDGLEQEWSGNLWINPPFSQTAKFIDKLCASLPEINQAILLTNSSTGTKWFRKIVDHASAILFFTGRIKFVRADNRSMGGGVEAHMLSYFGKNSELFLQEFREYGWGISLKC